MRTLACQSLGLGNCDFEARGETIHEVLEKMVDHIEERHMEEWAQMEKNMELGEEKDFLIRHIKDDERTPI